jgi:hypothetical protein
MKEYKYTPIGLVVIMVLMAAGTLVAEEPGWIDNSLSFKINNKFTLKFTSESRYNELTYSDFFMRNWQGGIVYKFSQKMYFAVLYKREDTQKTGFMPVLSSPWESMRHSCSIIFNRAPKIRIRFISSIPA